MPVSSVPGGALTGSGEVMMPVFHELSRAGGPYQQARGPRRFHRGPRESNSFTRSQVDIEMNVEKNMASTRQDEFRYGNFS
jgi:hypothetical protein